MNIKLDTITLLEKQGNKITEDEYLLLEEIKKLIDPRLSPFRKAIRKEEQKKECYIMMHILPPEEQWLLPIEKQDNRMRITLNGYSPELTSTIYRGLGDNKWAIHIREMKLANTSLN